MDQTQGTKRKSLMRYPHYIALPNDISLWNRILKNIFIFSEKFMIFTMHFSPWKNRNFSLLESANFLNNVNFVMRMNSSNKK